MSFLVVEEISKQRDENTILNSISFSLEAGEKLAIAGATGSGKTTLLKIIGGLLQPTTGQVLFNNERVKGPDETLLAGHPHISYLSQHFELGNNYRVNELLQMSSKLEEGQASDIYGICKIDHLLHRWTNQLSGGERQRISLAMALVTSPKLLLLDEPYSNLDAIHKSVLKEVLESITQQLDITTIIVSHDPLDVLSWAESIMVLQNGNIIQQTTPQEVYYEPVNEYAAALFGKYNMLPKALSKAFSTNRLFIRPSELRLDDSNSGVKGFIEDITFMGSYYEIKVNVQGSSVIVYHNSELREKEEVYVQL